MSLHHASDADEAQGQATFGMANLRKGRTGLPFIVFISQKDGARHDVRVKVAPGPKMRVDQMSSYSLRPFRRVEGGGLTPAEEALLQQWLDRNLAVIVACWDGDIEYTEDALEQLKRL